MSLSLYKTFDYSGVANTAAVGAGLPLLPGQIDNRGGVYSVSGGKLLTSFPGGAQELVNHLYYTGPTTSEQKIVVTGTGSISGFLRVNAATHTGYCFTMCGPLGSGYIQAERVDTGQPTLGSIAMSPAYNAAHVYQLVASIADSSSGLVRLSYAVFDLTVPGVGQPADPINVTDPGSVGSVTDTPDFVANPFLSGGFGIAYSQSAAADAQVSKVRLYAPPFTTLTDYGPGGSVQTSQVTNRVYLTGFGYTAGSPGTPAFTGAFTPTAGDGGSAPVIVSQSVKSLRGAVLSLTTGTAQGNFVVTDPGTGLTVTIPVTNSAPPVVAAGQVTAKTFLGSSSLKMDGTDETDRYQQFLDFLVRYAVKGLQEPGIVRVSRPVVLRDTSNVQTGSSLGQYAWGFNLEGMTGGSLSPGFPPGGCSVVQTGANQRSVFEVSSDLFHNCAIRNIGFFGNATTQRIVYFPYTNWNGFEFNRCVFVNGGLVGCVLVDVAGDLTAPSGASGNGNGEALDLVSCFFDSTAAVGTAFRNITGSGQAYGNRISRCQAALSNGSVFCRFAASVGGGFQADIENTCMTFFVGTAQNILYDLAGFTGPINHRGGRVEGCNTAFRMAGNASGLLNISETIFDGFDNKVYPGFQSTGPSGNMVNFCRNYLGSYTNAYVQGPLKAQLDAQDATRIVLDGNIVIHSVANPLGAISINPNFIVRTNFINLDTGVNRGVLGPDSYQVASSTTPLYTGLSQAQSLAALAAEGTVVVTIPDGAKGQHGTLPVVMQGISYPIRMGVPTVVPQDVATMLQQQGWY